MDGIQWYRTLAHSIIGLKPEDRTELQQQWMRGQVPVIVATISFGMGIDKANVRYPHKKRDFAYTISYITMATGSLPIGPYPSLLRPITKSQAVQEGTGGLPSAVSIIPSEMWWCSVMTSVVLVKCVDFLTCRFDRDEVVFLLKKDATKKASKVGDTNDHYSASTITSY